MTVSDSFPESWAAIEGLWKFDNTCAKYLGPKSSSNQAPIGIALSNLRLRSGIIESEIHFGGNPKDIAGHIIFGYNPLTKAYYSAGIGAFTYAYTISVFIPTQGWRAVGAAGFEDNLSSDKRYSFRVEIAGQRVSLAVNNIRVVQVDLPSPLSGDQVGLYAWGQIPIDFVQTRVVTQKPKAFVVMQFGEPYDSVYTEVIKPVVETAGLQSFRVDDVYRPGIILQDIIQGIAESEVIIAEITPPNPNVFYELGYAHAIGKPTILLADRKNPLPFDIRSYRCIFYDNTIKGKKAVENTLRKHLESVLDVSKDM